MYDIDGSGSFVLVAISGIAVAAATLYFTYQKQVPIAEKLETSSKITLHENSETVNGEDGISKEERKKEEQKKSKRKHGRNLALAFFSALWSTIKYVGRMCARVFKSKSEKTSGLKQRSENSSEGHGVAKRSRERNRVKNLIRNINREDFKKTTLGGCIFVKKGKNICLKVEKI